ncbi:MAG: hypothetical protein LBQ41_01820 [Candidatus Ancillula sp.]|jgi:hypothetical protein|nr:hypothetical protein [Candidatus Ancillula sp.]
MSDDVDFERRAAQMETVSEGRQKSSITTVVQQLGDVRWDNLFKPFSSFTQQEIDNVEQDVENDRIAALPRTKGTFSKRELTEEEFQAKADAIREKVRIAPNFWLRYRAWIYSLIIVTSSLCFPLGVVGKFPPLFLFTVVGIIALIVLNVKARNWITIGDIRYRLFIHANRPEGALPTDGPHHHYMSPQYYGVSGGADFLNTLLPRKFLSGDRRIGNSKVLTWENVYDFSGNPIPLFTQGTYWYEERHENKDSAPTYHMRLVPYFIISIENHNNRRIPEVYIDHKTFTSSISNSISQAFNSSGGSRPEKDYKLKKVNFSSAFDNEFVSEGLVKSSDDEIAINNLITPDVQDTILQFTQKWSFAVTTSGYFVALPPSNFKFFDPRVIDKEIVDESRISIHSGFARFALIYQELIKNLDSFNKVSREQKLAIQKIVQDMITREH